MGGEVEAVTILTGVKFDLCPVTLDVSVTRLVGIQLVAITVSTDVSWRTVKQIVFSIPSVYRWLSHKLQGCAAAY